MIKLNTWSPNFTFLFLGDSLFSLSFLGELEKLTVNADFDELLVPSDNSVEAVSPAVELLSDVLTTIFASDASRASMKFFLHLNFLSLLSCLTHFFLIFLRAVAAFFM